jgi:hypothetical protein
MSLQVEDLDDHTKYRQILSISYHDLIPFIFDYLKRKSGVVVFFGAACLIYLCIAIKIRMNISGYFPRADILFHSVVGLLVFPLLFIPVHEFLHILPYFLTGAKKIRVGMDLKQYLFYVTAHRYVTTPVQFIIVALTPFLLLSLAFILFVFLMPGLWKWSFSLFLFVHATMCAGDFAMINFYYLNRHKKIYAWDDADQKMAYFYEEI